MSGPALEALLDFLFWWSLITVSYVVIIFALDWLLETWKLHRARRRTEQRRLAQIDAAMAASLGRLATEFAAAQQAIRSTARSEVDRH